MTIPLENLFNVQLNALQIRPNSISDYEDYSLQSAGLTPPESSRPSGKASPS
jgi:hypothetical protein